MLTPALFIQLTRLGPKADQAGNSPWRQWQVLRNAKMGFSNAPLSTMPSPARFLTFKCEKCTKPVKVVLQKVSACSHIQPYLGVCVCGEPKRYATGSKNAVDSYLQSVDGSWSHHH